MLTTLESRTQLIYALRAYFLSASASVLIAGLVPSLNHAFIPYGKTRTVTQSSNAIIHYISSITVPKAWFWHFYLISMSLSIFWATLFVVCSKDSQTCLLPWLGSVDNRTMILWTMMLMQGCRRLYESLYIQKLSSARMWIGHYLVGCTFYTFMSMAVLAEGSVIAPGTMLLNFV